MRAGLLTERLSLFEHKKIESESGFGTKEWVKLCDIKAYRKKLKAITGDGVDANEEFISNTIVFQVRAYSIINENLRVEYNGVPYKIILLEKNPDNSYLMTCSKNNP
jgi:SPP1 family predicted phage head-tail adaptor